MRHLAIREVSACARSSGIRRRAAACGVRIGVRHPPGWSRSRAC